eukprot:scaffold237977_cov51-Prasinocladus_malaysianus.AAC.1
MVSLGYLYPADLRVPGQIWGGYLPGLNSKPAGNLANLRYPDNPAYDAGINGQQTGMLGIMGQLALDGARPGLSGE